MNRKEYDAVVVGSGPNGLAAAITLQRAGLSVLVLESRKTTGGGLRTKELTLPGFRHDVCSAIHPLAAGSPFFNTLPLEKFGLNYIYPSVSLAHPLESGETAILTRSLSVTAGLLNEDQQHYTKLISPLVRNWNHLAPEFLDELHIPKHPFSFIQFGLNAIQPAAFAAGKWKTETGRALWAGLAAHSILPLEKMATSAIALVLAAAGHVKGWPVPEGGSQSIADALTAYFIAIGGKVETGYHVKSLSQLPSSSIVMFDITPRQLLEISGNKLSKTYQWQLKRFRYGMGVFKIDWALDGPVPFRDESARMAGTIHLGNTFEEIKASENATWRGKHPDKPFVLLAQQSRHDPSRAPHGKQTLWGYCHVPNGSEKDMTEVIEKQVERFAPGFRDRILARHVMNTRQMEAYNPNYIGGDINGGALDILQLFTRPALRWSPYRTSAKGLYLCSSSTPPGGGVHGMCGYRAAVRALKDIFGYSDQTLLL